MRLIDKILLKLRFEVWAKVRTNAFASYYSSHSMFGEDMVVRALAANIKNGFYVDIGAFHPVFLSNTYHFYRSGWSGINIDASPKRMDLFKVLRPRDLNLELCLSAQDGEEVTFFIFEESAYNTTDVNWANYVISQGAKLLEKKRMRTRTLRDVLHEWLPKDIEIDLMNIDVENKDKDILLSNDWEKIRPKFLIFEDHEVDICNINESQIVKYLKDFDYKIVTKCGPSIILQISET
jgi:hypothetical protein